MSVLFATVYTVAFPLSVSAEETSICATVSEILETESEDCVYFIVKGDFSPDGQQGKELSICFDDGNDAANDFKLANQSFEKKENVYLLVDGSSVKKIQSKCSEISENNALTVRGGELSIGGESNDQKLFLNGSKLMDGNGYSLSFDKKFTIGDNDVVLMINNSGGTACPAQYFFVSVSPQGIAKLSPEFGTCSDLAEAIQTGLKIKVTMPVMDNEDEESANYVYKNETLFENGKEIFLPSEEDSETTVTYSQPAVKVETYNKINPIWHLEYILVKIFSVVDEVVINDVILNRGNCKIENIDVFSKRPIIPKNLKFGESVSVSFSAPCEKALQLDIITNQGNWTWTFND